MSSYQVNKLCYMVNCRLNMYETGFNCCDYYFFSLCLYLSKLSIIHEILYIKINLIEDTNWLLEIETRIIESKPLV